MAEQAALQRKVERARPDAARAIAGPRQAQLMQLKARLDGAVRKGPTVGTGVVQAVLDPAVAGGRQAFHYGLVKGNYDPATNEGDMHVDPKNDENAHLSKTDVIAAFQDLYQAMHTNFQTTHMMGRIDWNPQGAAVVKMVAELLGESLGGTWAKLGARAKKLWRQKMKTPPAERSAEALSTDIVSEHVAYLGALKGVGGVSVRGVGVPLTAVGNVAKMAEFNQNMVDNSASGNARLANYEQRASQGFPVSLSITLDYTKLPTLIATLQSA